MHHLPGIPGILFFAALCGVAALHIPPDPPLRFDLSHRDRTTATPYFSVPLPEGNYRVTLRLGDPNSATDTTVKAELRRLMLERVTTKPGQFVTRSFAVNIRTPKIAGGGTVRLKDREKQNEMGNWDDQLTLEFNGPRPGVASVEIVRDDAIPTIFLLGDSTVCDQPAEPWNSWGQMLPRFFDDRIAVANHAQSGESLRSSLAAHRLDKVVSAMRPGDFLLIQYGHNDMKERGEGVGAFTTYKADLKRFIDAARKKGGQPILVTSMHRKSLNADGTIRETFGDYPEAVRQTAREENVPLIDLHALSATLYEALGPARIDKAFQDGTHHNNYGSYELARCVVAAIRKQNLGPAKFIAKDVPPFDPARPDPVETFQMAVSPTRESARPDGDGPAK